MKANERKYMERGQFRIEEFENPKGKAWRVYGWTASGARVRKNFETHDEALAEKQRLQTEAANEAAAGRTVFTKLTNEQNEEAERAFDALKQKFNPVPPGRLFAGIKFFLDNYHEPVKRITVAEAFDLFIAAKRKEGCRDRTIQNLKSRVGFLKTKFGGTLVSDIMPAHVDEVLLRDGVSRDTRENNRRAISSFFSWCIAPDPDKLQQQGYCSTNPAKKQTRAKRANGVDEQPPVTFTLAESRSLIETAKSFKHGKLVPYISLGLFAGIRPSELSRIAWDDIDLHAGTIRIAAQVAKTRSHRIIEMVRVTVKDKRGKEQMLAPNLAQWLAPYADKKTPIKGPNWRKDFDQLKALAGWGGRAAEDGKGVRLLVPGKDGKRKLLRLETEAKLKPWTEDIMRHTAISNCQAQLHDENKTAEWAGNSPAMIHRHYRQPVQSKDAEAFWNIRPIVETRKTRKIVHLRKQAA
jgi:integrase